MTNREERLLNSHTPSGKAGTPGRGALALALLGVVWAGGPEPAIAGSVIESMVLLPGAVTGNLNPYQVKRGDSINWLGVTFLVNPIRITKPSAKLLLDGMQSGETIFVDQRRIQPTFGSQVTGLVLNLPEAEVYLVERGMLVKEYPVGVSNAEWKAPLGRSAVRSMARHPIWYVPKNIQEEMKRNGQEVKTEVAAGPRNPLGSRWIGFADGSFGMHGTTSPTSIKRYASHGCVRFLRPHIEDLYGRVSLGMPVRVVYQPLLLAVDRKSIWVSAYPDFYGLGFDYRGAVRTLATQAGVLKMIDWQAVNRAVAVKDGIVMDVGLAFAPRHPVIKLSPTPKPRPSATPTPKSVRTPRPTQPPTPSPRAPNGVLPTPTASAPPLWLPSPDAWTPPPPSDTPSVTPSSTPGWWPAWPPGHGTPSPIQKDLP